MKQKQNVLEDLYKEHQDINARLPGIGKVIEINKKNSGYRQGAKKKQVGTYEVVDNCVNKRWMLTRNTVSKTLECFLHSDLLFEIDIYWKELS